jgi:hypothetical protein
MNSLKNRWQALSKWQKALANLLLSAVVIATFIVWQYNRMPSATLYGYNHTDRPIFSYFVNGNWGEMVVPLAAGGLKAKHSRLSGYWT